MAKPSSDTPSQVDPAPAAAADRADFVGHAMLVSALTLVSRITGLARESALAWALGLGVVSDAFFVGYIVPNLFRRLFGEGALTAAFIPVYTDLLRQQREMARRLAWACLGLLLAGLGALTLLGEVAMAAMLAYGSWSDDSALAIRLTMIMLPYMPLICAVALVGAVLQCQGRFAPSAAAPILLNVLMIAGILTGVWLYPGEKGLIGVAQVAGLSVLVAGVAQFAWQLAAMLKHERPTLVLAGVGQPLMALLKIMGPMLIGLAVFQINTFGDSLIAIGLSPKDGRDTISLLGWSVACPLDTGAVAALAWAQRMYEFPLGVFGIAIATAIFPALAHAAADVTPAGRDFFRTTIQRGLRLTVFIGLPASVGLMLVRLPLSRVIYERGQFQFEDSVRVAWILAGYAPAIWAYSMNHVLTRGFYALKDARTPLRISLMMVVLNLVLNLTLVWSLGAAGLAWATAICAGLQNVLLLRAMRRYLNDPLDRKVWMGWARSGILTLIMAAVLAPITWMFDPAQLSRKGVAVELAAMVGIGAIICLVGARAMGMEELRWLRRQRA